MTPRGGPTLDFSLFGRYFLDLAVFYPGAFLCLAPLWEHVKAPRRTAVLTAALVTVICLAAAALCAIFELDSNILLLPTLLAAFWLLRWRVGPEVSVSQTAFLFAVSCVMMAVCTLLSAVLNARAEVGNDAPACLVSTSLIKLGLSAVLCIIFWFTAVQWSRWLLQEYRGEAFWQSAWPLPTIYAAFLVFCMPLDPAVVLINRLMIISVLAVSISLLGIFLLLYEMYQVAREYTRSAQLDRENQLLAVESRRYTELRAYMEQTRHLRHDFRQHLHVIAGLTEAGQVDELKNYLHQYESELSEERPTLCANPAVDALAGHYDHEAHSLGVPVDWRLELPRQLAIPEADFCMMLGNLLENAFHASQKLPPEQRQVKVMARMLSPAMLGLLVENRYDGVLKRQQGTLHSTKHDGMGIGLVSIQTAVSRYGGSMTVETEYNILKLLMQSPHRIFPVQVIYETVWGEPYFYVSNGTVMVHIRNLRMKVEHNPQNPQRICTVWGKGYRFAAQDISVRFVKENGKAGLAFENAVLPGQHRTDSTKVGLTSIETMMEKMHAACRIEQSGERFCITLLFPIALSVTPQA